MRSSLWVGLMAALAMATLGCSKSFQRKPEKIDPATIPVVAFNPMHLPANPNPLGKTSSERFWAVRSAILAVTEKFGSTGPSAKVKPEIYWLVDDQYNDDFYQNLQVIEPEGWTVEWLTDLIECLRKQRGWAINIGLIDNGHVVVFQDRVMVAGPTFAGCKDLKSVVAAARSARERVKQFEKGPTARQIESLRVLLPEAIKQADEHGFAYLATFDGFEGQAGNAIWLLKKKSPAPISLGEGCPIVRESPVAETGTALEEHCKIYYPWTEMAAPYGLVTYLAADKSKMSFDVTEGETSLGTLMIDRIKTADEVKEAAEKVKVPVDEVKKPVEAEK